MSISTISRAAKIRKAARNRVSWTAILGTGNLFFMKAHMQHSTNWPVAK